MLLLKCRVTNGFISFHQYAHELLSRFSKSDVADFTVKVCIT